jgi:hypothetical protein
VQRPALKVALRRGEAFDGQLERILDAIEHHQDLAAPLLREALARVIMCGGARSGRSLGQFECARESPGDHLESPLGNIEHERGISIAAAAGSGPGSWKVRERLLRPPPPP